MTDTTTTEAEKTAETTESKESLVTTAESKDDDESLITKGEEKVEEQAPLVAADLTLPYGFEINEDAQGKFVNILNEDLSRKELAGKLMDLQTEMVQAASESISDAWDTMQEEWKTAAGAHPDFGGDKLAPALGSIKELINEVMGEGAKDVFEALDLTGVGSHPSLISLLHKLAVERAEGAATVGSPQPVPQSLAEAMFPNQGK